MNTELTLPIIHLNGTGADTLEEGYGHAASTLNDLEDAFQRIEFNRRDYYVHPDPQAWDKALAERRAISQKLTEIREYINAHREHIYENRKH
jgi:hypothetical protein